MTTKVFIDGEAGTTGLQIRERLAPRRDLALLSIDPADRKNADARRRLLNDADIAILCLPDDAAREAVGLIDTDTRVIDASTAHRTAPGWTYGFAEMAPGQPAAVAGADRVTNPGCYPQGLIALMRPLVEAGMVPTDFAASYNAVSGYSGGGRQMIEAYEAPDANVAAFLPYGLTLAHKHLPEMTRYAGLAHAPVFQPAVAPYAQGMLGAVPMPLWALPGSVGAASLHAALADRYASCAFVSVAPLTRAERLAELDPQALNGTNAMRLYVFADAAGDQALLMAVYDNLGKGASGAAVQNLNLMIGADEAEGLAPARAA